jgi:hypothetical protein
MPPIYANDLVLITHYFKLDGFPREAAVTYAFNDKTQNASAQVWAEARFNHFQQYLGGRLDSNAQQMRVRTIKGNGTAAYESGESPYGPSRGTAAVSSLPPNCAQLVRKLTGLGGRKNRGRFYWPWFLNEGSVDEAGSVDAAWTTGTQTAFDAWFTQGNVTGDGRMVIANKVYGVDPVTGKPVVTAVNIGPEVTSLVVDNRIATQRRRLDR